MFDSYGHFFISFSDTVAHSPRGGYVVSVVLQTGSEFSEQLKLRKIKQVVVELRQKVKLVKVR